MSFYSEKNQNAEEKNHKKSRQQQQQRPQRRGYKGEKIAQRHARKQELKQKQELKEANIRKQL